VKVITMQSTDFAWLSDESLLKWLTTRDRRPNLMVVARGLPVDVVADHLLPVCAGPVMPSLLPGRLHLPASRRGTVLLQNVAALSIPQQIVLNDWIDEGSGQAQIVSIATTPLWRLVENGDFLEGLFYRLNVICLEATALKGQASGVDTSDCRGVAGA
jgi:transcriptional regulator of aromatic amino acid metabolism